MWAAKVKEKKNKIRKNQEKEQDKASLHKEINTFSQTVKELEVLHKVDRKLGFLWEALSLQCFEHLELHLILPAILITQDNFQLQNTKSVWFGEKLKWSENMSSSESWGNLNRETRVGRRQKCWMFLPISDENPVTEVKLDCSVPGKSIFFSWLKAVGGLRWITHSPWASPV